MLWSNLDKQLYVIVIIIIILSCCEISSRRNLLAVKSPCGEIFRGEIFQEEISSDELAGHPEKHQKQLKHSHCAHLQPQP